MESIQGSSLVMIEPSITDDETYHVIIGCIKSYKYALKLVLLISLNVEIRAI